MRHFDFFRYDINLLVAFDALYVHRNVTRAAEAVGISQSGMSHALAKLRETFDDPLFVRSRTGVEPTVPAASMAPAIAGVLRDVHAIMIDRAAFDPATTERRFALTMPDTQQAILLPRLLASVRSMAPGILVQTTAFDRARALAGLEDGTIDIAIGTFKPPLAKSLMIAALYTDRHVCLFNPRLVTLRSRTLDLATYVAYPHLLLSHGGDATGVMDELLAKRRLERRVIATSPYAHAMPLMLREVAAIGIVPARFAARCTRQFGLATAEPPLSTGGFTVSIVWHRRHETDAAHRWLRSRLIDAAAERDESLSTTKRRGKVVSRAKKG